jgi:hypothetical protein
VRRVGEQVGALFVAPHAAVGHLGAGRIAARIVDELVERFVGPGVAGHRLERVGIGVVLMMGDGLADDVPQIGTDAMGPALVEGVAGLAGARGRLARRGIGGGEQRGDVGAVASVLVDGRGDLGDLDDHAGLLGRFGMIDDAGKRVEAEHQQAGAQYPAGHRVERVAVDLAHAIPCQQRPCGAETSCFPRAPQYVTCMHRRNFAAPPEIRAA